jgi:hypothetical protein
MPKRIYMFYVLFLVSLFCALTLNATPPSADYELIFEDEFTGPVNESMWSYREGRRTMGTWINALNQKTNVSVKAGNLVITARTEEINGKKEYTGGGVISKRNFGYGYYETRSKPFMAGKGVHSAFWQAGGNGRIFEIDSYEIDSGSYMACRNLYVHICPSSYPNEMPWPHRAHLPFKLDADGWWINAYEYTPEGVVFYENGKVKATADFSDLVAQQVVWLTALNGTGKVDEEKQPGDTLFDYFRFYAKDWPGHNLLPNGNFEYNQDRSPYKPIAWTLTGETSTCVLVKGDAPRDSYALKIGAGQPHKMLLSQKIDFIRNGNYEFTAKVKRTGLHAKALFVVNGEEVMIPASSQWIALERKEILVSSNSALVELRVEGSTNELLFVDDIQFRKPGKDPQRPFVLGREEIWKIGEKTPLRFEGDGTFYIFGRNVGYGDAMTLSLTLTAQSVVNTMPLNRQPDTGKDGWALLLTEKGDVVFRIGSKKDFSDVIAPQAYAAGKPVAVRCVYEKNVARIYINGVCAAKKEALLFGVKDATKAGKLGTTESGYEAVGEVMGEFNQPKKRVRSVNFKGQLSNVRIYNKAVESR